MKMKSKMPAQVNPKRPHKHRVILIGLDSADPDLIQKWSSEGRLPFIKSLIDSGVYVRLQSTLGLFSDSPWPSFHTGVNPAKHGYYNYIQLKRGSPDFVKVNARSCRYFPFWALLREDEKKVAIFDVPKTYPVEGIDGVQISAWGEHYPMMRRCSIPPVLMHELAARFGKYRQVREITIAKSMSQERRVYHTLQANVEKKLDAARFLLAQDDWDLFVTVFGESHWAGHQFFHYFDRKHWAHPSENGRELSDALPNIYGELDACLASLLEEIRDATIFIFSVHGIATNFSGNHLLPEVLERLGFLVVPVRERAEGSVRLLNRTQSLRDWIPGPLKEFVNKHFVPQYFHDDVFFRNYSSAIDWKATKAFVLPKSFFEGFVSVNLRGREPWGTVEPGSEYKQICRQLRDELMLLRNPKTGWPAVENVVQIDGVYKGEQLYALPDLVVKWAEDGPVDEIYHPKLGVISRCDPERRKSRHSDDGFMIASGAYIHRTGVLSAASTMDLAPTVLYLLGQAVPNEMDGHVLIDIIDEEFKAQHELRYENRSLIVPNGFHL
jgi:predicted AlkP superfamily phosphohydrolase/phosphomutase